MQRIKSPKQLVIVLKTIFNIILSCKDITRAVLDSGDVAFMMPDFYRVMKIGIVLILLTKLVSLSSLPPKDCILPKECIMAITKSFQQSLMPANIRNNVKVFQLHNLSFNVPNIFINVTKVGFMPSEDIKFSMRNSMSKRLHRGGKHWSAQTKDG